MITNKLQIQQTKINQQQIGRLRVECCPTLTLEGRSEDMLMFLQESFDGWAFDLKSELARTCVVAQIGYQCFDFGSKMTQSSTLTTKLNPLMNFFLKRQAQHPLPQKKPIKKIKPNDEKNTDPLYQILSWRDEIKMHPAPHPNSCSARHLPLITQENLQNLGKNLQGIFINIDWNVTPMSSFKKLNLSNDLLTNGMVFIWGGKTNIGEMMDYFDEMGYVYAENFTFVLLSRQKIPQKSQKQLAGNKSLLNFFSKPNNSQPPKQQAKTSIPKTQNDYEVGKVGNPSQIFLNGGSQYFCESQRVLYMFRKINKKQSLQLRHQRTSDVYFTIGEDSKLDWKGKQIVYRMIETLLISANYKEKEHLKLMELWSEKDYMRKGWITVSQQPVIAQQ